MINVGDVIRDQYELKRLLGSGSFGEVYLAEEKISRMQVAVKILTEKGKIFQNGFEREAQIMARLQHPHIVRLLSAFSLENNHFLVMEYCAGGSLGDRLLAEGPMSEAAAFTVLQQLLQGLAFAHSYAFDAGEKGVIHRDLKPENVFFHSDGAIKIGDFGISRIAEGSARFSSQVGTPQYMAPEQFEDVYDFRADLYALGMIFYHMLAGRPAFTGSYASIMRAHLTLAPHIPEAWSDFSREMLTKLLAKKPEERYQTAVEALAVLANGHRELQRLGRLQAPAIKVEEEGTILVQTTQENIDIEMKAPEIVESSEQVDELAETSVSSTVRKKKRRQVIEPSKVLEIDWVLIQSGEYEMGDLFGHGFPDELPVHKVRVEKFYLSRTPVTVSQYKAFCKATGRNMPKAPSQGWTDQHPIVNVNWDDAQQYCEWIGGRLPTEAEWEYAARDGGVKCEWSGTNRLSKLDDFAWHEKNSSDRSHAVRKKRPNALGLYDMSGNVWEWCSDSYLDKYRRNVSSSIAQGDSSGPDRVLRGGSWDDSPRFCRNSSRYSKPWDYMEDTIGFRVARDG